MDKISWNDRLGIFLLLMELSGCVVGPDYVKPEFNSPKNYNESHEYLKGTPEKDWWSAFDDKVLTNLIRRGIEENPDIQVAYARIKSARAERQHTIATGLPNFSARADLSQRENVFVDGQSGGFFGNSLLNVAQEGLSVQWEIDPAGGLFRRIERAEAEIDAKSFEQRALLVSLQGDIASVYIELRTNQEKLSLTKNSVNQFHETYILLKTRAEAGLDNWESVSQQQELVSVTEAFIPTLEKSIRINIHHLSILLGAYPGTLSYLDVGTSQTPTPRNNIAVDLPADLIRRRPDVVASERLLASASAEQGAAMALQYPKINLTSFIGAQNTQLGSLIPMAKAWSYGGGISTPIFNWGRIQADIDRAQANYDSRYFEYKRTILTAYKEVEDFLVGYKKETERKNSLSRAVDASNDALSISEYRYLLGLTPFVSLLQNQANNYRQKLALVENKMAISMNVVGLYKSLGGGWQVVEKTDSEVPLKITRSK